MNDGQRHALTNYAHELIGHAPQIDYVQRRPMGTRHLTPEEFLVKMHRGERIAMDCSESVTMLYRWARCKDPNGRNYDGSGWSGAMFAHLTRRYTNAHNAHPGALLVFGPGGDEHVAMVIEHNGTDPVLFSHGSQIGPLRISYFSEIAFHAGQPRVFLDVSEL